MPLIELEGIFYLSRVGLILIPVMPFPAMNSFRPFDAYVFYADRMATRKSLMPSFNSSICI